MTEIKRKYSDLIRTINDGEEVEDLSDKSDEEIEYQPTKQKSHKQVDFNPNFKFVSSVADYNKDTWDDLAKYVKRKVKNKTDDRITKMREQNKGDANIKSEDESEDDDATNNCNDIHISDDEMKKDNLKVKPKKLTKKQKLKAELDAIDNPVVEYDSDYFEEAPVYDENATFYAMNLSRPLLKAIGAMNFVNPTPIQSATIPVALLGKDVCGCAATGTGKTAAYMLPTLERLLFKPHTGAPVTRVVVLVPTRELGVQVYQVTRQLTQFTQIEVGMSVGGLDLKVQESVLRKNPDVVIATPGRLIDHLKNTPSFSLHSIEVLILDEADRMLDEYFADQMKEIIKMCSPKRQTMLFSATMTEEVKQLAAVSLSRPVKIFVNSNKEVAFNLRQEFVRIRSGREGDREAVLGALVCRTFRTQCMVFVGTRAAAHRLHLLLGLLGVRCAELHGALPQPQRLASLKEFKEERADVLIATDVAARGLDISGVKTVINYVMPATVEHYIHRWERTSSDLRAVTLSAIQNRMVPLNLYQQSVTRWKCVIAIGVRGVIGMILQFKIAASFATTNTNPCVSLTIMVGRTARAGRAGVSVSLAGEKERKLVKDIVKRANQPVKARVIPPDILDKYRTKVETLDPQIESILQEEYAERLLSRAENQHNRMEKRLAGPGGKGKGEPGERERPWFQSPQERKAEKERLALGGGAAGPPAKKAKLTPKTDRDGMPIPEKPEKKKQNNKKTKKGGFKKMTPEERAEAELDKVAQLQVRIAKRSKRAKRIQTVYDDKGAGAGERARAGHKRKAGSFARDLTDISSKGAKRMRYDANQRQKEIKTGKSFGSKKGDKSPGGKKGARSPAGKKGVRAPKGKAFGKPQKSKKSKFE